MPPWRVGRQIVTFSYQYAPAMHDQLGYIADRGNSHNHVNVD
jgi:hypothetical protein